jgi:hypothetical protein
MNEQIKQMKLYLTQAEGLVDTVYNFAQEYNGFVADKLRSDMNDVGGVINYARSLLDNIGMPKKDMLEKLEMAQSLLSSVYHDACEHGDNIIETAMSVADGCIDDAISRLSAK